MSFYSILTHKDGTLVTMKELRDMEEEFDNRILEKYKSGELKLSIATLQYLERRKALREKMFFI